MNGITKVNVPVIVVVIIALIISMLLVGPLSASTTTKQQKQVLLKAIVVEPEKRWKTLFGAALEKLREKHPELSIDVNYTVLPYFEAHKQILESQVNNKSDVDLYSIDQIWLGEFAQKGLLENLTSYTTSWNRSSDWNEVNWNGGTFNDTVYGIWAWTDVRALWYWKDILNQSGIQPDSLGTWNGYLNAAKKLENSSSPLLNRNSTHAVHLVGASHSPDMWYPYLWMNGGDILSQKEGHPTKGTYWFPSYNSTAGVKALTFLKEQIDAGIRPQLEHFWGKEFADKRFAVMLEGSWMPGAFPLNDTKTFQEKVGLLPMFPVSEKENSTATATLMGGWELGIASKSTNKALTWELIATMVQPDVLLPTLKESGYLPTQKSLMTNGTYVASLNASIPYYSELVSMIGVGHIRPNIAEYAQIADQIKIAIDEVYHGVSEPQEALDNAAYKTAKLLGWGKGS